MKLNTNRSAILGFVGLSLLGAATILSARAQESKSSRPAPAGKITPWEAIKIATGKVPGRALNANFEFDDGHWTYGVMVVNGKTITEVEIDPMTGKIGDTETVTPESEAKETKAELTAAISGKSVSAEKDEK